MIKVYVATNMTYTLKFNSATGIYYNVTQVTLVDRDMVKVEYSEFGNYEDGNYFIIPKQLLMEVITYIIYPDLPHSHDHDGVYVKISYGNRECLVGHPKVYCSKNIDTAFLHETASHVMYSDEVGSLRNIFYLSSDRAKAIEEFLLDSCEDRV